MPGAQGGGGQGNRSGGDLLLGVHEQVDSYSDVGEVIAKPASSVDERQVDLSHHDEDCPHRWREARGRRPPIPNKTTRTTSSWLRLRFAAARLIRLFSRFRSSQNTFTEP